MGHSYAHNARGNLVLVCDVCGGIGGVRTRQCPHRVLIASRFTERQRLPLCIPPALCPACFHDKGATHGLHADCAPAAAELQTTEDAAQARLDAGEWHLMSATQSDRQGVLVVSFSAPGGIGNGFVQLLVPEVDYDARAKLWLSDYPNAEKVNQRGGGSHDDAIC